MKRFFTLLIGLIAIVGTAGAYDDIYLRTDYKGTDVWNSDNSEYKFTYVETNSSNEDVYTYTINASDINKDDVWFRIHISGWGAQICPYTSNGSYSYIFSNGQNETIGAKYEKTYFQGADYSFGISHSTIKASQYKITLFRGNNETYYENETCRVMWIKVEIVTMPLTISAGQATFSCDRALNFSDTGVNAYAITGVSNGDLTKSSALTTVPANTGLYITGTNGTYNIPVIETSGASDIGTNWMIAGTDVSVPQTITGYTNYILTNKKADGTTADSPKFFKINSAGNVVPKGKAYLQVPDEYASAHESLWFGDDETTDIKAIKNGQITIDNNAPIYNLAGQRVANGYKGVVIQNGKKLVIK